MCLSCALREAFNNFAKDNGPVEVSDAVSTLCIMISEVASAANEKKLAEYKQVMEFARAVLSGTVTAHESGVAVVVVGGDGSTGRVH